MDVKIRHAVAKAATGTPMAQVGVHSIAPDDHGMCRARVVVTVSAFDRGVPESFATIRMSASEARDVAAWLVRGAEQADAADAASQGAGR